MAHASRARAPFHRSKRQAKWPAKASAQIVRNSSIEVQVFGGTQGDATAAIKEAVTRGGVDPGSIAGIGITNQRETTLIWDRETGAPLPDKLAELDVAWAGAYL